MQPDTVGSAPPSVPTPSAAGVCSFCHQPVQAGWYFCPNCGTKINAAPLSTSVATQAWIYAFSIILPVMCYLFVTRWPGMKYFKSSDPKARQIGEIAWVLIIFSTIITLWFAYVWTQEAIQAADNSINADMSGDGY